MQLLDATIAFALTLAGLGTAVTVIMEAIHRVLRIRKGNLILVLQHLNKEISKGPFRGIKPLRRWDFIANVLNNTTRIKNKLPDSSTVGAPSGEKSVPIVLSAITVVLKFGRVAVDAYEQHARDEAIFDSPFTRQHCRLIGRCHRPV
jgi:hypothetical protein